jgi:hypothetical protein
MVDLECMLQKLIDQDGAIRRDVHSASHVMTQYLFVAHDSHTAATEHV